MAFDFKKRIPGANNFTYEEFVRSSTALRRGILNVPNREQIRSVEHNATTVLQPIRNEFGPVRVTSGFCSRELCPFIPRSIGSNHVRGEAADIEPVEHGVSLVGMGIWIAEHLLFRELIFEFMPEGWIHVASRKTGNISEIKIKDEKHNYTRVDLEYIKRLY